tara:strand:+ start:316 stop:432 length:117 start_codon:yes stop_codon:yes gene_type:complete
MLLGDIDIKILASLLLIWVIYSTANKLMNEKNQTHSID